MRSPSGAGPGLSMGQAGAPLGQAFADGFASGRIKLPLLGLVTSMGAGEVPSGCVVWFTKGSAIPLMKTTPGAAGAGPNPAPTDPESAANSATLPGTPVTPTPPTKIPPLYKGTPPGFTALWSESFRS